MPAPRAGEFELIRRHFAPLASRPAESLGLTDDAAVLRPRAGMELVVTADALVAGVHFFADDPADLVARKALRVNLSDLAAKGAVPRTYFLCAAWPLDIEEAWIAAFAAGLATDQAQYGVALGGGDTTSTPGAMTLAITAIGECPVGTMITRAGGSIGDDVWVSGTIGDAALGLRVARGELGELADADRAALLARYRLPAPRLALGSALRGLAHAAMDVSDGLVQDLGHLCRLASCAAAIADADVPLSTAAEHAIAAQPALLDVALTGGDDYELLFLAEPERRAAIVAAAAAAATRVARIGTLIAGEGVSLIDRHGAARRPARGGWNHFESRL
jgi:thiamine-monophosphate kinase